MKNILSYTGNASHLDIRKYVDNNIELYVEPFAGSFGCGFRLMEQGYLKDAILNDKDYYVYNFWKCVKEDYEKVIHNIKIMYNTLLNTDKDHLEEKLDSYKLSSDPFIQAAYEYLYAENRHYLHDKKGLKRFKLSEESFIDASIRLMNTEVVNNDYSDVITKYDSQNTFFMIDPPYDIKNINKYYRLKCSEFNHEALRNLLETTKGTWLLRYNYSETLYNMYKTFNIIVSERPLCSVTYKEIFVSNKLKLE